MTHSSSLISHRGVVVRQETGTVWVRIEQISACSGCHAASVCGMGDKSIKEIKAESTNDLIIGDWVVVEGSSRLGLRATLLVYVIPLVLIVAVIALSLFMGVDEGWGALLSLLSLIPYYGGLFLFRRRFEREFVFVAKREKQL